MESGSRGFRGIGPGGNRRTPGRVARAPTSRFGDPRVHFAINCASKSCPPLRSEPYFGMRLDQQLDDSTRLFLNNPANYRFEGNEFYVSRIFKWFAEDFNNNAFGFYLKYATGDLKKKLEAKSGDFNIKYLPYDWSLNGH